MTAFASLQHHSGQCRCGALQWILHTAQPLSALTPRACDCDFCRTHGACWFSDADAQIELTASHADDSRYVQQGSEQAQFLQCTHCDSFVAVLFRTAGDVTRCFAALNARCLHDAANLPDAVPASPKLLSATEKAERWSRLWCAQVNLTRIALP